MAGNALPFSNNRRPDDNDLRIGDDSSDYSPTISSVSVINPPEPPPYTPSRTLLQSRPRIMAPKERFRLAVRQVIILRRLDMNYPESGVDPRKTFNQLLYGHIQASCLISCVDYAATMAAFRRMPNAEFLAFLQHLSTSTREPWVKVRWINIQGISWDVLASLAMHYDLHPLSLQDVLKHRPTMLSKVNEFAQHLFLRVQCHELEPPEIPPPKTTIDKIKTFMVLQDDVPLRVRAQSFPWFIFLLRNGSVITVTPNQDERLEPINRQLRDTKSMIRSSADSSLLVQAILNLIVDQNVAVADEYQQTALKYDRLITSKPSNPKILGQLQLTLGDIRQFRMTLEPLKSVISGLRKPSYETYITSKATVYLSEVYDKCEAMLHNLDSVIQAGGSLLNYSQNFNRGIFGGRVSLTGFFKPSNQRSKSDRLSLPSTSANSSQTLFDDVSTISISDNIYDNLYTLVINGSSRKKGNSIESLKDAVKETANNMRDLDPIHRLIHSQSYRVQLLRVVSELSMPDDAVVRKAIQKDEVDICNLLRKIINTPEDKRRVLDLKDDNAQAMLNLIQSILDKGLLSNPSDTNFSRQAHRLLIGLSKESHILPSSLSLSGITLLEKDAAFGGGFADIFRGMYQGEQVAIKRMRVFQRDDERHKVHRMIACEALVWQRIKHPYVLPFLGIDSETFPSFFCLISPWMMHGTILRYFSENGRLNIEQRIQEVAEGLEYLHSQGVVHGDLRGGNILIDSEWHARLADFGLTVLADGTMATHTSNVSGSTRWMAPELHDPQSYGFTRFLRTKASDIYAFGCTCLEIYTLAPPFADVPHDGTVLLKVLTGVRPKQPPQEVLPPALWVVIESTWRQAPDERPTASIVVSQLKDARAQI